MNRNDYVVIIEKDGDDPLVVGFESPDDASRFIDTVNMLGEDVWPESFHNYARATMVPLGATRAMQMIVNDAVIAKGADRD